MDVENTPMTNDELQHWGIKGMKWGIRRFQKKDGSLTPAGRKRYDDDGDGGGSDGNSGNRGSRQSRGSGKKKVSEMTDEELQKAINRARMEDAYRQLRPEKESTGQRLMRSMINDAAIPAAVNAGKNLMQKALEKYGGNLLKDAVDPNSVEAMKATLEKLELKNKIKIAKDGIDENSEARTWDDLLKKRQAEENRAKREKTAAEEAEKEKAAKDKAEKEAAKEQAKSDEYNDPYKPVSDSPDKSEPYRNSTPSDHGYTNPSESRGLAVYNAPVTSISKSTVNSGRTATTSAIDSIGDNKMEIYNRDNKIEIYNKDGSFAGYATRS